MAVSGAQARHSDLLRMHKTGGFVHGREVAGAYRGWMAGVLCGFYVRAPRARAGDGRYGSPAGIDIPYDMPPAEDGTFECSPRMLAWVVLPEPIH